MLSNKSTLFLAPQHSLFTVHYFDLKTNCTERGVDQTIRQSKFLKSEI